MEDEKNGREQRKQSEGPRIQAWRKSRLQKMIEQCPSVEEEGGREGRKRREEERRGRGGRPNDETREDGQIIRRGKVARTHLPASRVSPEVLH